MSRFFRCSPIRRIKRTSGRSPNVLHCGIASDALAGDIRGSRRRRGGDLEVGAVVVRVVAVREADVAGARGRGRGRRRRRVCLDEGVRRRAVAGRIDELGGGVTEPYAARGSGEPGRERLVGRLRARVAAAAEENKHFDSKSARIRDEEETMYDVYIRVSRLGDRTQDEATEVYEAQCRDWAGRTGISIDEVEEDTDVSGSVAVAERKLERLIQKVEAGESEGILT